MLDYRTEDDLVLGAFADLDRRIETVADAIASTGLSLGQVLRAMRHLLQDNLLMAIAPGRYTTTASRSDAC